MVSQGEVFWVDLGDPKGSEPGFNRPCVVVQNDVFNASGISTVVVAVVTSNLRLGEAFGNVKLRKGEASLPRPSVVNISQLTTIDKAQLVDRIGKLGPRRLQATLAGINSLLRPVDSSIL
jgi:mRNA interferase MazF